MRPNTQPIPTAIRSKTAWCCRNRTATKNVTNNLSDTVHRFAVSEIGQTSPAMAMVSMNLEKVGGSKSIYTSPDAKVLDQTELGKAGLAH